MNTTLIRVLAKDKIIKILDGTIFKICPADAPIGWGQGNLLKIHHDEEDMEYPYRIANPIKSQWVRGKRVL